MYSVKFLTGTKLDFDNLLEKEEGTLYFLSDTQEIYKGNVRYGSNTNIVTATYEEFENNDTIYPAGTLLVYTDKTSDSNNTPGIKISDGEKPIADLPFTGGTPIDDGTGSLKELKPLKIGNFTYDGTTEVVIPIYNGQ